VVAHLVKQHENAAENVTPTHGTVLKLMTNSYSISQETWK
jgi:hypothetical protein